MLSVLTTLVLGYAITPPFESIIQAHQKLNPASIQIISESRLKGKQTRLCYEVEYARPNTVRLVISQPDASRRTYLMKGTSFLAYDSANDEFMKKSVVGKSSMVDKLATVVGSLDESVKCAIDPANLKVFFAPLHAIKAWTRKSASVFIFKEAGRTCLIEINPKTRLLTRVELTGVKDKVVWRFKYLGTPKLERPTIPVTAIRTVDFTEKRLPPTWLDSLAKNVADASIVAYGNLKTGEFELTSDSVTHVFMDDGKIRMDGSNVEWRYDGANLLVLFPKTMKAYAGKLPLFEVASKLTKLGVEADGFIWYLVLRQNPMRKMLLPASHVRLVGSLTQDGSVCDILEMVSGQTRVRMAIRSDSHLIVSVSTYYIDDHNVEVGEAERKIRYIQTNGSLKPDVFDTNAPTGYVVSKLP
jgi:hypothetical protein